MPQTKPRPPVTLIACPTCGEPMNDWDIFQCFDCSELTWDWRTELYRQEEAVRRLAVDEYLAMVRAASSSLYRLEFPWRFIQMDNATRRNFSPVTATYPFRVFPTGSRMICSESVVREDSDWDLLSAPPSTDIADLWLIKNGWEPTTVDSGSPNGFSWRKGQLNMIVFTEEYRYKYEAWKAATVWCTAHAGQFNERRDRVSLFERAERERWVLP